MDDDIPKTVHDVYGPNDTCCYRPNGSRISNCVVYMMYYNILVFDIFYNMSKDPNSMSEIMII